MNRRTFHNLSPEWGDTLLTLTAHAHQRLDAAGVDRYSPPIPWHIARTTFLDERSRRHPNHQEAQHA